MCVIPVPVLAAASHIYTQLPARGAGVGKTTLINALRGVRKGDPGYATTAAGTVGSAKYPFPGAPHLMLWDIPDNGDAYYHPTESYWTDQCLDLFDCLVIVVCHCIPEEACFVAQRAAAAGRRFVFVHTKSEYAVTNTMGDDGLSREEAVGQVRTNVRKCLRSALGATGAAARLLLVESHLLRRGTMAFDESELYEFLLGCTAERTAVGVTPEELITRFRAARDGAAVCGGGGGVAAGGAGGTPAEGGCAGASDDGDGGGGASAAGGASGSGGGAA